MSFAATFLRHPRKLFLRRALFQTHLWAGVLLAVYVVVIALTGSVLVFRTEIERASLPKQVQPYIPGRTAPIATVLEHFQQTYPDASVTDLQMPSPSCPVFVLEATKGKQEFSVVADPMTGASYPMRKGWLDTIYDLHVYLLLGHSFGAQVNAIGASILLILCITGLVIWWPGIKIWTRGFKVAFGRNWRRINFDLHSAIGIWTLALVSWWAISGIYFGFYKQVTAAVAWVSPLDGMVSPVPPMPTGDGHATLQQILDAIKTSSPHGTLFSLSDPLLKEKIVYALVDLRQPGDFSHRDIITLSTTDARVLTIWHYGRNQTLGDWIIWSMHPLHFGNLWGLGFKVLWSSIGLSLALLTITGLLMYWNRWLRHRF